MNAIPTKARVLLLVEDSPGDALLAADLLSQPGYESYQIVHAPCLKDAVERLRTLAADVIVLDLHLPDCSGLDGIKALRKVAERLPIVVLTGTEDEQLALSCINAGAQDFLLKSEVRAQSLRRALGYAIARMRETQVWKQQEAMEQYRALSSAAQGTTVTATLAGSGAVALRSPKNFAAIVEEYYALIEPYLGLRTGRISVPRSKMEHIITALGDANGGPRDLLDVHVAAMERATARKDSLRPSSITIESRLLALEMMGLLVDYYRVGYRRVFVEGHHHD